MATVKSENTTPVPDLYHVDYIDDDRFSRLNKPDLHGKERSRQYVCDQCRIVYSRKPTGCPAFDGQYVNLKAVDPPRDPIRLKEAWLGGWDATWRCTACWCETLWDLQMPLKEVDKVQMRFHLEITTGQKLYSLWFGSRKYGAGCSSRSFQQWAAHGALTHDTSRLHDTVWRGTQEQNPKYKDPR